MARIAVNGLGRIGKLVLRRLIEEGVPGEIVLLNEPAAEPEALVHLLEFDSVHGRWRAAFAHDSGSVTVAGHRMPATAEARIEDLPLGAFGVEVVIDCTGVFRTPAKLEPYFGAGMRMVLVSAPVKEAPALNLVYGVNHGLYDPGRHRLITAASCTTNCLAPIVKVLHEGIGIRHGSISTIHDATNTQVIVDRPGRDLRRARSALNGLIPTTTGSATAIGPIYPELAGRLNGHAVRVPLLNASLTDCVFEMARPTEAAEVNRLFREAAEGALAGILGYEERPLVSADFVHDPRSAIIDAPSTMVVNGTQVKVYAWYDNE
ncbi:MAG TPA: ArsJ-associated glyceraldehyde-3-phosphate dehydrogenase, partial [Paracoccaceae bacterium]|nr:ArsJ-associated glyceraldehyde-3-phosphate dehydrogenase [Paracoccaceae bacterium]